MALVACAGLGDLFFSYVLAEKQQARAICVDCPYRRRCFMRAVVNREHQGIWGGVDFARKRQIRIALEAVA